MTNDNEPQGGAHDPDSARIAKVIARAGLASRREAESWIAAGRVAINGKTISSPAVNVGPRDKVTVDGEPLPARERTRLWLYHKPRGLVTTARDPEGRTTVFDVLPPELPRVVSVGRLDLNTEGLLLLTNDGGLAKVLAHPSTGWLRRYRVRAFGVVDIAALERLKDGVTIDGFAYGPIEAVLDRQQGDNAWLTLGLREGKNREVRKVLEHLGLMVNRLLRVSFGPFQLGDIAEGAAEEVRTRHLRDQLGSLAEEAGCDFEAPIVDRTPKPEKRAPRARAEIADAPRRRAGLTQDRKGRRVLVERVEKVKGKESKAARPRRSGGERRGPPHERDMRPRRESFDRDGRDMRTSRPSGRDRPQRDGDRPRPFGKPREEPAGRREKRDEPRPYGNRARVFRARPDSERKDRPPRKERRDPPRDRASGPRRDSDGPRRPGGKPSGRPSGPPRGRPGGGRPGGGRPRRPR